MTFIVFLLGQSVLKQRTGVRNFEDVNVPHDVGISKP